jgi:hypothetical protein
MTRSEPFGPGPLFVAEVPAHSITAFGFGL